MNHVDCVIKRDVYPQKMHSCSKNIRDISFFVLKISVVYQEKDIIRVIAWVFCLLKDKFTSTSLDIKYCKIRMATSTKNKEYF